MSARINAISFGVACGAVLGIIASAVTALAIMMGEQSTLAKFFISLLGYEFNMQGVFIALLMGVLDGFIAGAAVAYLYNLMSNTSD